MSNFDIDDYIRFIKTKIQRLYHKKSSLTEEEIINYCSQFVLTTKEFFHDKNQSTTSEKLRKIFGSNLDNKPVAVAINTYFLFEYGYIYCNTCNTVLPTKEYYTHKSSWHGFKHYCKVCQADLRDNEHSKKYIKNNRDKYNSYLAKYRANKLQAAPKWLSDKQLEDIKDIYKEARKLGLEVDHIIPLQGSNVCGLHVPWNLQLLSRQENASKSNKF